MLDCHEYLARRGWKGKGTALRSGGIAKPVNVIQKRTLSGLGKDRDEAFPFWEHVYDTSISAINIKVHDTDSEGEEQHKKVDPTDATIKRTSTGIISNRRPTTGVDASNTMAPTSRLDILGNAKRSLAQRQLYSRFFRGPIITDSELDSQPTSGMSTPSFTLPKSPLFDASLTLPAPGTFTPPPATQELSETDHNDGEASGRAARREARRARREQKLQRRAAREARRSARATATPSNLEFVLNNVASTGDGAPTKPDVVNVDGPTTNPQLGMTLCPLPVEDEGGKREKKKKRRRNAQ